MWPSWLTFNLEFAKSETDERDDQYGRTPERLTVRMMGNRCR